MGSSQTPLFDEAVALLSRRGFVKALDPWTAALIDSLSSYGPLARPVLSGDRSFRIGMWAQVWARCPDFPDKAAANELITDIAREDFLYRDLRTGTVPPEVKEFIGRILLARIPKRYFLRELCGRVLGRPYVSPQKAAASALEWWAENHSPST